jgi:cob(I)alamin adenosyltransferase
MKTQYFTAQGDAGKTKLGSRRIAKDHPIFFALGDLDRLLALLGICRAILPEAMRHARTRRNKFTLLGQWLVSLQELVFLCAAEIAQTVITPRRRTIRVSKQHLVILEQLIMLVDRRTPRVHSFVIPGGTPLSAFLDYARTAARDAERSTVKLTHTMRLHPELSAVLNRLSSVLFALARYANALQRKPEQQPSYVFTPVSHVSKRSRKSRS